MPDLLEISFHHKNHFISIHFIDSDSMLQVLPESLHFMCNSDQPNCNPSWNPTAILDGTLWRVINAELRPGEYNIGWASCRISHVLSRCPSVMNFCEDAGIERVSIQVSSYHHSTVLLIQDKQ